MEDPIIVKDESTVIQNSDYLYKSKNEWITDVPYSDPSPEELKLLEGTVKPEVLLKAEREEVKTELTPEQQRRNAINIIKVVSLNRIGLHHFIMSPYKLSTQQKKKYKESMSKVLEQYNESIESREVVIKEFNEIVNDILLDNGMDVSQYPVYDFKS